MSSFRVCIGVLVLLTLLYKETECHRCDCFIKDCMKYQAGSHPRCACCVYYTLGKKRSVGMAPNKRSSRDRTNLRYALSKLTSKLRSNVKLDREGVKLKRSV